jgi:hypothetical protein
VPALLSAEVMMDPQAILDRTRKGPIGRGLMEPSPRQLAYEPPPRRHPPQIEYLLAIPTNGRPCLRETLESFRQHVSPSPGAVLVFQDGCMVEPWAGGTAWNAVAWSSFGSSVPLGFCEATSLLWREAARADVDWVFWLEDDFLFERDVELRPLAEVLFEQPRLTQMALMRGPANSAEEAAGSVIGAAPAGAYRFHETWIESRRNHSTGCSLMRRAFMEANPWPLYESECEGQFSLDLLAKGFTFGVWGQGEAWVEHVGQRAGFGY